MIPAETWREVRGPDAEALADVAGELTDIRFARRAIEELLGQWPAGAPYGPDTIGAQALWAAALVAYARCFVGGVRTAGAAAALVGKLPPDEQADHARFRALRDKHVAHSVNAFEQATVAVVLGAAPEFEVLDVKPFELMTALPDRPTAERFGRLLETWTTLLLRRITELKTAVMAYMEAMPREERARLPGLVITPPTPATDPAVPRPHPPRRSRRDATGRPPASSGR